MSDQKKKLTPEENLKVFHALDHPIRLAILSFIYDETKDDIPSSNKKETTE